LSNFLSLESGSTATNLHVWFTRSAPLFWQKIGTWATK
jgi:hypothetical protein